MKTAFIGYISHRKYCVYWLSFRSTKVSLSLAVFHTRNRVHRLSYVAGRVPVGYLPYWLPVGANIRVVWLYFAVEIAYVGYISSREESGLLADYRLEKSAYWLSKEFRGFRLPVNFGPW